MARFPLFGFLLICLSLGGCAVGPDFKTPDSPKTQEYTSSKLPLETTQASILGGQAQKFIQGRDIPQEWWQLFKCPSLTTLIKRSFENSPDLAAAQAALQQAQYNLEGEIGAAFLPALDGTLSAQENKDNQAASGKPELSDTFKLYNASINVSYTFDFFGSFRRQIEALQARLDFQNFKLEAAYLTLAANIVSAAITEASLRAQIQATQKLINLQENQLEIIKRQIILGSASEVDLLTHGTLLTQTRATLPPLENKLLRSRHALAVLTGGLPSDKDIPKFNFEDLDLPLELPVSLPSMLVRQRPDIRAAEALLHEASAQVGVAAANLYPQFTLTGSFGSQTNKAGDLLRASTGVWGIAGQILQPIFRGGALIAQENAAIAFYENTFAQYRQTVLQAFQEVADTLDALKTDAQTLKDRYEAETYALQSLHLSEKQFQLGAISYLALLNAEQQYHQAHMSRIQAQAARYADTATLFQALGGGWWNRPASKEANYE